MLLHARPIELHRHFSIDDVNSQLDAAADRSNDNFEYSTVFINTVVSSAILKCRCCRRFVCGNCHNDWVSRRWRSSLKWLDSAVNESNQTLFGLLSIADQPNWLDTLDGTVSGWQQLGRDRSAAQKRAKTNPLKHLNRGIGGIHLMRQDRLSPHMHAVAIVDRKLRPRAIEDAWASATALYESYAEFQTAERPPAALRYSIDGALPKSPADRIEIAATLAGFHMIRRIGS